jgi:maltooligosyltrehalose trehalohydrolase
MLFMGEEYGEDAPFQFFTDHIDEKIATATREGRRREFAAFASFSGQEVPDPQDPATFERSKLTRRRDRRIAALVKELLRVRAELGDAPAEVVAFDEPGRWLRVRRGDHELVLNFGRAQTVITPKRELVLSTSAVTMQDDGVRLRAMSGALLR